jgi:hypothetical protein
VNGRRMLLITALALAIAGRSAQASARYQKSDEAVPPPSLAWAFDDVPAGEVPPGATAISGSWAVWAEPYAPSPPGALCQTGTAEFPALSLGDTVYDDVALSAQVKPISGRADQAAGLIVRIQDRDNYYILRANALENNVNFYKYAAGRRSTLKEAAVTVQSGIWQSLRFEAIGTSLRGFINDLLVVEATDATYQAGQVGLWTKADSRTCFDDVDVRAP